MSMIKHHATIETLAAYAAGHLDEARSVVIATHIDRCAQCRKNTRDLEALGGACLDSIDPAPMADDALKTFWKIADNTPIETRAASTHADNDAHIEITQPLNSYLKGGLEKVKWRTVAPGISQSVIKADGYRDDVLRLLKINSGTRIPCHSHGDNELTLILQGQYEDALGTFAEGDLADLDDTHTHEPQATGDEPCICLIATSAPLVFKGVVGKVIQPFVRL